MVAETKAQYNSLSDSGTIGVQIGDVCCALKCRDRVVFETLHRLYHDFLSEATADISVELEGFDRRSPAELEAAVSDTRYIHEGNQFRTSNLVMSGRYDLESGLIRITGERNLVNPDLEFNHLNQLLSLAYYTACKLKYGGKPPAFLVHACGIIRHGQAILFTGPCEAGKTTVARLCGEQYGQVINDEMVLVSRSSGNELTVQSTPMLGGFPRRQKATAPLGCVLLLKQSQRMAVRCLDRTEAFLRFLRQIVTPAYIGQKDRRAVYSLMAEFSDEVTGVTPFSELEFTLDRKSLWQTVAEVERWLEKRNAEHGKPNGQG